MIYIPVCGKAPSTLSEARDYLILLQEHAIERERYWHKQGFSEERIYYQGYVQAYQQAIESIKHVSDLESLLSSLGGPVEKSKSWEDGLLVKDFEAQHPQGNILFLNFESLLLNRRSHPVSHLIEFSNEDEDALLRLLLSRKVARKSIHIGCGQEEEEVSLRETIMVRVDDLVINFTYYDRKDDNELSAADLESAISCGQVTVDEIVERFRIQLREAFSE